MSKSDHSKSRMDRFNDGDRVTRRHSLVSKREHIAEELAIHSDAELASITNALVDAITWTSETPVVEIVTTSERKVDSWADTHATAIARRARLHYSFEDDSELMMTSRKHVRPVQVGEAPSLMAMAKR